MLEMHGLEASHSPPEDQGQPLVSEAHWDWGHYGVSCTEPQADMSPQLAHQSLFPVNMPPNVAPSALVRPPMSLNPSNLPLAPAGAHVPVLQHSPDPRNLGPSVNPMAHMGHHHYPPIPNQPPVLMEFAPSRKRNSKQRSGRSRRAPRGGVSNRASINGNGYRGYDGSQQQFGTSPDQQTKAQRTLAEQITLSDDAPEADRYLFELRNSMLESKGKGMWEALQSAFTDRYGPKERAALQMQLSRAVMKHGQWPESEDEALRKAVAEVNRRRYNDIAKVMKEHGGCRAWDFSDLHISKRMVELGLEEYDPEEPSKRVRRARKPTARRTTSVAWSTGYHQHQQHQQQQHPPVRTLTLEQEEHLLQQFCKPDPETPPPAAEPIDELMAGNGDSPHHSNQNDDATIKGDPGRADSARVAKRACEQMFNKSGNPIYGALSGENRHPMP
ncbi:hypothetical protein UCREL1_2555 [Eutypa lata UCREL1]|uniref:Uncharacterized protein n=1 Tax=Eutypa lata (strain UCR-EL1) TaxID=1287681 RepID=M7TKD8_EUTLA|nr:hypothetical protein UCREL1_2555 [Eutypa lata UCREL1]